MWDRALDDRLRAEAMDWLKVRSHDGSVPMTSDEIAEFTFEGRPFPLKDRQRGIRKPAVLDSALSITTTWRKPGEARPYEDEPGPDGLIRYKWREKVKGSPQVSDVDHPENRALRSAMTQGKPLIWFWGVGVATYQPIFPIYLVGEELGLRQFVVATDGLQQLRPTESPVEEIMRAYVTREVQARVHQRAFRGMVMRAYGARCAICALRHDRLIDAAHIVEDRHELGVAAIRNGIALCKIHHAAYDHGIMGIDPDMRVHVRDDVLSEIDGPLLEHGIKALHGGRLVVVPKVRAEQPDPALLEQHFLAFLAA